MFLVFGNLVSMPNLAKTNPTIKWGTKTTIKPIIALVMITLAISAASGSPPAVI